MSEKTFSRRDFLKVAAVGAGVLTASRLIPGLLKKPTNDKQSVEEPIENKEKEHLPYSEIRGVTFYLAPPDDKPSRYYKKLEEALPKIKSLGFNCVKLVSPWLYFQPKPIAEPKNFNEEEFKFLVKSLELLKQNNMSCILGLNYLDEGWAPEGINRDNWIEQPDQYGAFEAYAIEYLKRISNYANNCFIMVFTEGTEPYRKTNYDPKRHAALLQNTLGSFPTRVPPELRKKFPIGYHDYSLVTLDWAGGESPVKDPKYFDFVSMTAYGFEGAGKDQIYRQLDLQTERFRALFPNKPLILGEIGCSSRSDHGGSSESTQATVDGDLMRYALQRQLGFNMWSWVSSDSPTDGGLGINNPDGSPKEALYTVQTILKEDVANSSFNK